MQRTNLRIGQMHLAPIARTDCAFAGGQRNTTIRSPRLNNTERKRAGCECGRMLVADQCSHSYFLGSASDFDTRRANRRPSRLRSLRLRRLSTVRKRRSQNATCPVFPNLLPAYPVFMGCRKKTSTIPQSRPMTEKGRFLCRLRKIKTILSSSCAYKPPNTASPYTPQGNPQVLFNKRLRGHPRTPRGNKYQRNTRSNLFAGCCVL